MAKICLNVFEQWFTLLRITQFPRFGKNFPKILFVHHNKYQYLKFSPRNFIFTEGIKQPVRPFYLLCKGRYPGGEIVRQGGPEGGCWGIYEVAQV
jgi:hypothetical protein